MLRAPTLGQTLGPPQRGGWTTQARVLVHHPGELGQLEEVNQLVPDRMAEVLVVAVIGKRDATLQELGETGHALGEEGRRHVGLLEVLVRRVDDQRNPAERPVAEERHEGVEALLGVA